ncbi:MAG TPA: aspartate aminotransferase family protein [Syntrophomonadaceae bacterium]|nr:aspartate aminotransferase family protein [Syntrophomonadaceae bacterium]
MSNQLIIEKGQQYVMNTYGRFPIAPVKGQGCYVWDADGKEYLDFLGGIAVCVLGHCDPRLQKVIQEQAARLWHISNLYWIEPQVELAEKLVKLSGLGKAFFCNSGAEANEAAIKLARKYFYRQQQTEKYQIISFKDSFHGRTLSTVAATGQEKYHEGFAPLPEGFLHARFNDIDSVKSLLNEHTAAIMVEPIQGEGGIHPAAPEFLKELRLICSQNDLLLIFDEVQCGMGRSGEVFAYQTYDVLPDIVTLAKGLGGGFPIGAMVASDRAASGFAPGDHASTFGGNPLATAVANQTVDIISRPAFLEQVQRMSHALQRELESINDQRIVSVRGRGLMLGVEFNQQVNELIKICMEKGLLLIGAGANVVRWVPPLIITDQELRQAMAIFTQALKEWK